MTDDLDIEALLEAPFKQLKPSNNNAHYLRAGSRSRSRSRSRSKGGHQRSRSPSRDRRHKSSRHHRYSRSRSPTSPSSHSRTHNHHSHHPRQSTTQEHRRSSPSSRSLQPFAELPMLTETQRDRRTVFCRQLAQRCDSQALKEFCAQAGKVRDARIVYDKISKRSKGVAYVEFHDEESVPLAVALTGKKLLGIPIIVELTETEKNRLAEEAAAALRLEKLQQKTALLEVFISNLHPSIVDADLKRVFQPFGDVTFVQVSREDSNRSTAIIQFKDQNDTKQAGEKMNGFELAGRPIRLMVREATVNGINATHSATGGERMTSSFSDPAKHRDVSFDDDGLSTNADRMLKLARDASALKGLASTRPSPCIILQHLYDPAAETEPDWEFEIAEEVQEECSKFGKVEHLHIPKTSDGDVLVRFASTDSAQAAVASLNGRWFGGMQVVAMFIPQNEYLARYPK